MSKKVAVSYNQTAAVSYKQTAAVSYLVHHILSPAFLILVHFPPTDPHLSFIEVDVLLLPRDVEYWPELSEHLSPSITLSTSSRAVSTRYLM